VSAAEVLTAEAGGFLFAGAVLAVARECVRKNWVKVSVSFGITTPAARQVPPEPVPEVATGPVPIDERRGAA